MTGTLRSVDPATGDEVARLPSLTATEVDAALAAAHEAQRARRGTSLDERARLLAGAARLLRQRREPYAALITMEMGKPIAEARAELDKCALICAFYAEKGAGFLAPEPVRTAADDSFAAPTLMAGLGASVWTRDAERGLRVARQLQSGAVSVNAVVASDPRLPFGGIKRSGYGRELSAAGIREFTNLRTYWISGSATPAPGAAPTE